MGRPAVLAVVGALLGAHVASSSAPISSPECFCNGIYPDGTREICVVNEDCLTNTAGSGCFPDLTGRMRCQFVDPRGTVPPSPSTTTPPSPSTACGGAACDMCADLCPGYMQCFVDPSCADGGLGCGVGGMTECRFCESPPYESVVCLPCPTTDGDCEPPTPSPSPPPVVSTTPPPSPPPVVTTTPPPSQSDSACSVACLELNPGEPCYTEPQCAPQGSISLGCNAGGIRPACRYCGFGGFEACPDEPTDEPILCPEGTSFNPANGPSCPCTQTEYLQLVEDGAMGCTSNCNYDCFCCSNDDFSPTCDGPNCQWTAFGSCSAEGGYFPLAVADVGPCPLGDECPASVSEWEFLQGVGVQGCTLEENCKFDCFCCDEANVTPECDGDQCASLIQGGCAEDGTYGPLIYGVRPSPDSCDPELPDAFCPASSNEWMGLGGEEGCNTPEGGCTWDCFCCDPDNITEECNADECTWTSFGICDTDGTYGPLAQAGVPQCDPELPDAFCPASSNEWMGLGGEEGCNTPEGGCTWDCFCCDPDNITEECNADECTWISFGICDADGTYGPLIQAGVAPCESP